MSFGFICLYIPYRAATKKIYSKVYPNLFIYLDPGIQIFKSRFVSFDLYSIPQPKFRSTGRQVPVTKVSCYQFCDFPILWIKVFPKCSHVLANI